MKRLLKLKNVIQPYAWGSRRALGEFLGQTEPRTNPQAELWMGAHPKAPSKVWLQGRWQSLDDVIREFPDEILGAAVKARFGDRLPYLFKVLAADQPLSIQAHPSKDQAVEGFKHENEQGIPLSAGHRNYKDDRYKPECISAMTPFWGVCGFRLPKDILTLLQPVWPDAEKDRLSILAKNPDSKGLRLFFKNLMTCSSDQRKRLVIQVTKACEAATDSEKAYEWTVRLNDFFPEDIGVLSPILLNLVCLQPGEALFLPSGQLHAYFVGMGIEIMSNSDNVLRGGLTTKHVDVPELLKVLDFEPRLLELLKPAAVSATEYRYPSQAEEFVLSIINTTDTQSHAHHSHQPSSPQILLCAKGTVKIEWDNGQKETTLNKSESLLVPAAVKDYTASGEAVLYKAAVNLDDVL